MLGVGVQSKGGDPDVAVQDIASLDHGVVAELLCISPLPLYLDRRLEPGAEAKVVDLLSPPPHEIARACDARANDLVREHAPDELVNELRQVREEHLFVR